MKKVILLLAVLIGTVVLLCSCDCKHENLSQATCTTSATCLDCGETISAALGHTDGEWITDKEANCTEDGSKHQVCSVCEATIKTETITKLGHTDGEWITDKEANCTEDGSKHQVCSVCEATIKTETITKLGHTDGEWITDKEANCTEDGSKHQVCSVCEATIKSEVLSATGHVFGDWYVKQEATCAVKGAKERICHCNVTETIPYTVEHSSEFISAVSNNSKYIATWHCPICDVNYDKEFAPITASCSVYNAFISSYATIIWELDIQGGIGDYSYNVYMYEQSSTTSSSTEYLIKEIWTNETSPYFAYNKSNTSDLYKKGIMFRIEISDDVGVVTYQIVFDNYMNSIPTYSFILYEYKIR